MNGWNPKIDGFVNVFFLFQGCNFELHRIEIETKNWLWVVNSEIQKHEFNSRPYERKPMVSRTFIRPAISGGDILGGGLGLTIALKKNIWAQAHLDVPGIW